MSFCARGKFWEKEPHTHSPPPLSVVGVSNSEAGGKQHSTSHEWEGTYYGGEEERRSTILCGQIAEDCSD
jgi:hypothetical protein